MAFLVWVSEDNADDSLNAIHEAYGLPFEAENGYRMEKWDIVKESSEATFGFYEPEERLGRVMADLTPVLVGDFTSHDQKPEEFE